MEAGIAVEVAAISVEDVGSVEQVVVSLRKLSVEARVGTNGSIAAVRRSVAEIVSGCSPRRATVTLLGSNFHCAIPVIRSNHLSAFPCNEGAFLAPIT